MHFYHTNWGIVTSYSLPLGMWISPGIGQIHPGISVCVASELQPFLTINIGNIDWVSNFPCKQPTYSLWVRCSLHSSRVTFNPKSTMMKHLSCQKRVCLASLSPTTLSTPFPTTSTALALWAGSSGWAALQAGLCLLESLSQHVEGLNTAEPVQREQLEPESLWTREGEWGHWFQEQPMVKSAQPPHFMSLHLKAAFCTST